MGKAAVLSSTAYTIADEYRNGRWPELKGRDWTQIWTFLVEEFKRRCPGFTEREYDDALNTGFFESR